LKVTKLKQNK